MPVHELSRMRLSAGVWERERAKASPVPWRAGVRPAADSDGGRTRELRPA